MKMRDPEFGGYYDRVGPNLEVINDNKTGFSSFALFSLAHAGRVTGDRSTSTPRWCSSARCATRCATGRSSAPELHARLHDACARRRSAGLAGADLEHLPARSTWCRGSTRVPLRRRLDRRGAAPGGPARRHGINLHMFEALLALYEATKSEEVWYQITQELKAIERLYDYEIGYLPESYDENWKPVGNPSGNPGHLFEWASLLSRAVELGADPKFIELGSRNLDLGLKSYNEAVGGLGGVDADGKPSRMLWWPQCEVIKATANYAILHGRTELWRYHHKTLDFVKNEYLDTEDGGWFADYVPGQPRAERGERAFYKGSVDGPEWGAYHQMSMFHDLWRITDPDYKPGPAMASRNPATRGKE